MLHRHHQDRTYIASLDADRLRASRPRPSAVADDLAQIVSAAGQGDPSAWSALTARFRGHIMRVARSHGLNAHQADDVVQETWLRLYRNLESVRDPRAIGAWLDTTARRECLRALHVQRREEPTDEELGLGDPIPEDSGADVLQQRKAALARALETLPGRQRELMESLLVEPAPSYSELSARLGIPIGSIGPTRGRCLQRLRRELVTELALIAPRRASLTGCSKAPTNSGPMRAPWRS